LTGTIGQGGFNRPHDVALVQALLGAKRDRKSNRLYLRDHVTGGYDKFTAEALLRYRMDQRDTNIKRPFARSGPQLNRLAQGQAFAVPEGMMKAFSQDWGIAFDVEIKVVANNLPDRTPKILTDYESRPLVAHFRPRILSVRLPRVRAQALWDHLVPLG